MESEYSSRRPTTEVDCLQYKRVQRQASNVLVPSEYTSQNEREIREQGNW
jgi:hypothetical protein